MLIIEDLKYKSQCFFGNQSLKGILRVAISDGTSVNVLYRTAQFFQRIGLGVIGWIFLELNKLINGCVIGRRASFGKGLVVMHGVGVVINGGVVGGENIVIESGVVLGAAKNGIPVKVPKLGSNIFIGAGAKVLGGITVGNHAKIGANAVVVKDVPDGVTVVGIPARVVKGGNQSEE